MWSAHSCNEGLLLGDGLPARLVRVAELFYWRKGCNPLLGLPDLGLRRHHWHVSASQFYPRPTLRLHCRALAAACCFLHVPKPPAWATLHGTASYNKQ